MKRREDAKRSWKVTLNWPLSSEKCPNGPHGPVTSRSRCQTVLLLWHHHRCFLALPQLYSFNAAQFHCAHLQVFSLNPYEVKCLLSIRNTVNKMEPFEMRVARIRIVINITEAEFVFPLRCKLHFKLEMRNKRIANSVFVPQTSVQQGRTRIKCAEDADANARHAHASIVLK